MAAERMCSQESAPLPDMLCESDLTMPNLLRAQPGWPEADYVRHTAIPRTNGDHTAQELIYIAIDKQRRDPDDCGLCSIVTRGLWSAILQTESGLRH